jgi:hypothetical protein
MRQISIAGVGGDGQGEDVPNPSNGGKLDFWDNVWPWGFGFFTCPCETAKIKK